MTLNDLNSRRQKILSDINTYKESLSKYQKIAPWGADAIRLQRSLDQANSQLASIDARISSVSSKTIEPQKEQPSLIRQEFNKRMEKRIWDVTKSFDDAKLWTAIAKASNSNYSFNARNSWPWVWTREVNDLVARQNNEIAWTVAQLENQKQNTLSQLELNKAQQDSALDAQEKNFKIAQSNVKLQEQSINDTRKTNAEKDLLARAQFEFGRDQTIANAKSATAAKSYTPNKAASTTTTADDAKKEDPTRDSIKLSNWDLISPVANNTDGTITYVNFKSNKKYIYDPITKKFKQW